ncbi:MAG: hypothetical protein M1274_07130 [Actinobacteria bacterium]|nr:hypothetical protein [Actinomycetota bacterium]
MSRILLGSASHRLGRKVDTDRKSHQAKSEDRRRDGGDGGAGGAGGADRGSPRGRLCLECYTTSSPGTVNMMMMGSYDLPDIRWSTLIHPV